MNNDKAKSIVMFIGYIIISFVLGFVSGITGIGLISYFVYVAYIVFMILGIVKANNGEAPKLHVIGNIAKSVFGKQIEG